MKQLYWKKTTETIMSKGKMYYGKWYTKLVYLDNPKASTKIIEDFDQFYKMHYDTDTVESDYIETYANDDWRTFRRKNFEAAVVSSFYKPVSDDCNFSKIMNELNYKDFIEFVKDNNLPLAATKG